ncbi:MAG: hypothetical protein J5879_00505, partial [Clostridia bacterium]|nr:hypothetical protein [Clostridia bacterium]
GGCGGFWAMPCWGGGEPTIFVGEADSLTRRKTDFIALAISSRSDFIRAIRADFIFTAPLQIVDLRGRGVPRCELESNGGSGGERGVGKNEVVGLAD